MNPDRVSDIPIRHWFVDYVCTIGYSEHEGSFTLVKTRFLDPHQNGKPKHEMELYLRILREPALRANLLEALVPEAKAQISELREKAISERGKNYGFSIGFAAFVLTGYSLHIFTKWLGNHIGYDWAEMITYIPIFFAFLIIFPVEHMVERWHARQYCYAHNHRLETFEDIQGNNVTRCKRCGLNISKPA